MAIPFNLPDEEDDSSRLDQLLLDLYQVLRQLLNGEERRESAAAAAPGRSRHVDDVTARRQRLDPVADEVSSTLHCQCPCQTRSSRRRQRRRRRRCFHDSGSPQESADRTSLAQVYSVRTPDQLAPRRQEDWLLVGEHLRKIAEEFKTAARKKEHPKPERQDLQLQVKTSGLFSLLVPSHFRHSLWTTVVLLVGWRILVRTR